MRDPSTSERECDPIFVWNSNIGSPMSNNFSLLFRRRSKNAFVLLCGCSKCTLIVIDFPPTLVTALFEFALTFLHLDTQLLGLEGSESEILLTWPPLRRTPSRMESIKSSFCMSFYMRTKHYEAFDPNRFDSHWLSSS